MAAPFGKVTWSFFDPGFGDGWSETLYNQTATIPQLIFLANAYASARYKLMGTGQRINYIRVAIVTPGGPGGGSQLINPGMLYQKAIPFGGKDPPGTGDEPDNPWNAILTIFSSATPGKQKLLYLRGVPDRVMINPPGPAIFNDPIYQPFWAAYTQTVIQGGWGWLARAVPPAHSGNVVSIVYTPAGAGTTAFLTITTDLAHGILKYAQVQFRSGKVFPRLRGVYTVSTVPTTTSFTVPVNMLTAPIVQTPPKWNDVTLNFIAATAVGVDSEVSRRVGRPLGQSRGRRRHVLPTA
jgi:hypothetical protein